MTLENSTFKRESMGRSGHLDTPCMTQRKGGGSTDDLYERAGWQKGVGETIGVKGQWGETMFGYETKLILSLSEVRVL